MFIEAVLDNARGSHINIMRASHQHPETRTAWSRDHAVLVSGRRLCLRCPFLHVFLRIRE